MASSWDSTADFGAEPSLVTILPPPYNARLMRGASKRTMRIRRREFRTAAGVMLWAVALLVLVAGSARAAVLFHLEIGLSAGGGDAGDLHGWQLFAVDTNENSLGISSYYVEIAGATSVRHVSPQAMVLDSQGELHTAGFTLLRTGHNSSPIHAAVNLPGLTPFLVSGFGQHLGSLSSAVATFDPGARLVGPEVTWGTDALEPVNGRHWMLLAEGHYSAAPPTLDLSGLSVTVYNPDFSSRLSQVCLGSRCSRDPSQPEPEIPPPSQPPPISELPPRAEPLPMPPELLPLPEVPPPGETPTVPEIGFILPPVWTTDENGNWYVGVGRPIFIDSGLVPVDMELDMSPYILPYVRATQHDATSANGDNTWSFALFGQTDSAGHASTPEPTGLMLASLACLLLLAGARRRNGA